MTHIYTDGEAFYEEEKPRDSCTEISKERATELLNHYNSPELQLFQDIINGEYE